MYDFFTISAFAGNYLLDKGSTHHVCLRRPLNFAWDTVMSMLSHIFPTIALYYFIFRNPLISWANAICKFLVESELSLRLGKPTPSFSFSWLYQKSVLEICSYDRSVDFTPLNWDASEWMIYTFASHLVHVFRHNFTEKGRFAAILLRSPLFDHQ